MSLPLDFHPAVRDEIAETHDWYEQRRSGLGQHFLDEVQRVLAAITANPAQYGFADADIRAGPLSSTSALFEWGRKEGAFLVQ